MYMLQIVMNHQKRNVDTVYIWQSSHICEETNPTKTIQWVSLRKSCDYWCSPSPHKRHLRS